MLPVLIVEDNIHIGEALRVVVQTEGYRTLLATDGRAAVQILRQSQQPLIVLLDYDLPVMTGQEVLEAVESDPSLRAKGHRFILMTAEGISLPRSLAKLLLRASIPGLQKPFELDYMFALLARVAQMPPTFSPRS
jgi:CheY-like chemotaxis protein